MAIINNNPVGYKTPHGVTIYNLENQVLKNKVDIQNLQTSEKVLATFGIKVIGTAANSSAMPTVAVYKANNPDWEYGDAYAVGTASPYEFYILTRADETHTEDYWFNLGVIKGPKGDPGADGANGADGKDGVSPTIAVGTVTTGNPGTPVSVTNGGTSTNVVLNFRIPKGATGDKGAKGDKGDTGFAVNIASELNNINELPTASASYVNIGYVIKDADGDSNLYVCMTNASTGAWYWNNVGKIAFSADYVSQNEYNQDKLTNIPVTLYDGGTQNTTINLKNGNGNLIGTGFGFGTINGNDILVNSNNVEGNLELVQVIDMSNYTFAEITNHSTEMFAAMKNFLTTNKVRAVGVNPVYSSASKMIAAVLLLKDGQFSLKSINNNGQGTVVLTFIEHGLSGTNAVVDREVAATIIYTNGVPTSLNGVTNNTYNPNFATKEYVDSHLVYDTNETIDFTSIYAEVLSGGNNSGKIRPFTSSDTLLSTEAIKVIIDGNYTQYSFNAKLGQKIVKAYMQLNYFIPIIPTLYYTFKGIITIIPDSSNPTVWADIEVQMQIKKEGNAYGNVPSVGYFRMTRVDVVTSN